ncbi:hypothetical protein [Rhizorhapis sp.]|uniref:hypothetical protein n=1 Tax=Rhizorhapis sp. TaxID=1968842 RepID=UPI002B459642|nr:hypothetical protein [Rhizorhapis sp.]HKR16095.1 hypothetical protein [Rhizorhapis sp.]
MDAAGGFLMYLFIYATAVTMLPSAVAGAVVGALAGITESNPFSRFHHCLFIGVVWSVALIFIFGATISSLMSYALTLGFLLIVSTISALGTSLFFWFLVRGVIASWRMLRNSVAS